MEKVEIYEKLNENLRQIENVENEISMIEVEMFERNTKKLKKEKLEQIVKNFENKAKVYSQNIENYREEITSIIDRYDKQISKIINIYHDININAFKTMQESICNKNIAIANIVKLENIENQENMTEMEKKEKHALSIALALKKLNYEVIIAECRARIKWCIEEAKKDIEGIYFEERALRIHKDGVFQKFRMFFYNKMYGKRKYSEYLEIFKNHELKEMESKNIIKVLEVSAVLNGFLKQMKDVKQQINIKFDEDTRYSSLNTKV